MPIKRDRNGYIPTAPVVMTARSERLTFEGPNEGESKTWDPPKVTKSGGLHHRWTLFSGRTNVTEPCGRRLG
jgi:hypothetical protein